MAAYRVSSLHIFPVKSCQGIAVDAARVTPLGLEHDRRWCVVDASDADHDVMTQYTGCPKLASIGTSIEAAAAAACEDSNGVLVLRHALAPAPLRVPIRTRCDPARRVKVGPVSRKTMAWGEDEGDVAAAWLTHLLGGRDAAGTPDFRLVVTPMDCARVLINDVKFGRLARLGEMTGFADTTQLTLANAESLRVLNERIAARNPEGERARVSMDRFRMNIIIDNDNENDDHGGGAASDESDTKTDAAISFAEDGWKAIDIVGASSLVSMRVVFPDLRCNVTTIRQKGPLAGQRDARFEPLTTLRALRKCKLYSGAAFGIKCNMNTYGDIHDECVVRVGDRIKVGQAVRTPQTLIMMDYAELQREMVVPLPPMQHAFGAKGQARM